MSVRDVRKTYRISVGRATRGSLSEAVAARLRAPRRRPVETFDALAGVSFDVGREEVLGIIGRNGAGKSTMLKILSRITRPDAGVIELYGRVGSLLEVGTGFHPELTGRENVFLNGAILGMSRRDIQQRFDEIVDFAEVDRFLDTPVKRYSSGMYVRLAFAVAAHLEPDILVIDEVLAVGDAAFQRKCLGKMRQAGRDGRTVLFVSHNMVAVEALCTRAIHFDRGSVVFDGAPATAVSSYLSANAEGGQQLTSGIFDLTSRTDGATEVRLERLTVQANDQPTGTVQMGRPMSFVLDARDLGAVSNPYFGLRIRSETEQVVAGMNTAMRPAEPVTGDRVRVRFDLPKVPFTPGLYTVDIGLAREAGDEVVDFVEKGASFEVVPADVYASSYQVTHREGMVFLDFEWRVEA